MLKEIHKITYFLGIKGLDKTILHVVLKHDSNPPSLNLILSAPICPLFFTSH